MRKYFYFVMCLAGTLAVSAQTGTNAPVSAPSNPPATASVAAKAADAPGIALDPAKLKAEASELPTLSASTETKFELDDKHSLGPRDQLSFLIKEDKDLSGKPPAPVPLKVTDAWDLEVPYIGRVSVKGKTCKQAAAEIKVQLEKDYYYTATVKLGLDQVNQLVGRVYVTGNVHNQGSFELLFDEPLTASHAIAKAGGFTDFANRRDVIVVRKAAKEGGAQTTIHVNVDDVQKGKLDKDVPLEPGDTVMVSQRLINVK